MTSIPPPTRLPANMLMTFDVVCGDELFPGHIVLARGLVDLGRSQDDADSPWRANQPDCRMVALAYELRPGVTRAEQAVRRGRPFTLDATYDADVPLAWSTGGSGPDGLSGPCSVEAYDETQWAGDSTWGHLGPWPVPDGSRRLTFWLRPIDGDRATGVLAIALATGEAAWRKL